VSRAVELFEGARVLMSFGPALVVEVGRHGVTVKDALGENHFVRADQLTVTGIGEDGLDAIHLSIQPWWNSLSPEIKMEVRLKLEVVLEVLTGYCEGHPLMAREGEPFYPFGEGFDASLTQRIEAMARQLTFEYGVDRTRVRRVLAGEIIKNGISANTIRGWIKAFQRDGLRGLVDGRKTKGRQGFEVIDPRFVRMVDEELEAFDGTKSKVSLVEIERRILVRLKQEGIDDIVLPQRITQQYLSTRFAALGRTTKQHKTASIRKNAARSNYPATHPGHFAVDVTRCDNLVWDDVYERVYSVEIITIISIPTRVVVACRVVPQSANSLEVALALYDAIRPFSMVVEGTTIDDFRWCGIPASLDFGDNPITAHASRVRTSREVQGRHVKPGISFVSLRADNGKIFLSEPVLALLRDWGVDFMPSRPGRPLDNNIVERWHDRLQAAYQSFRNGAGFKGRAVYERGRYVGWVGFEPLGSWRELQQHLHRFVGVSYHRDRHEGVKIPGVEDGNFTPIERHDMLMNITGRLLVPQHPDLILASCPRSG
jgi:putative transposase